MQTFSSLTMSIAALPILLLLLALSVIQLLLLLLFISLPLAVALIVLLRRSVKAPLLKKKEDRFAATKEADQRFYVRRGRQDQ